MQNAYHYPQQQYHYPQQQYRYPQQQYRYPPPNQSTTKSVASTIIANIIILCLILAALYFGGKYVFSKVGSFLCKAVPSGIGEIMGICGGGGSPISDGLGLVGDGVDTSIGVVSDGVGVVSGIGGMF
jgi:hypothetical protein